MNILAPINSADEILTLSEEGNTEFFCGYIPTWWISKYCNKELVSIKGLMTFPINNRYEITSSFHQIDELRAAVKAARMKKSKLFLVINFKYYPEYLYSDLRKYLNGVIESGIERVIICDLGLLKLINDCYPKLKVSISCLDQVTNSKAVEFYKSFKVVDRIVFPRHMATKEIVQIAMAYPSMEFEYFIFSNKCFYDDGHCRAIHEYTPICREDFIYSVFSSEGRPLMIERFNEAVEDFKNWSPVNESIYSEEYRWGNICCSACSLYNTVKIPNIKAVKLSIRGKSLEQRKAQIKMAKKMISEAENGASIEILKNTMCSLMNMRICDSGKHCIMKGDNW